MNVIKCNTNRAQSYTFTVKDLYDGKAPEGIYAFENMPSGPRYIVLRVNTRWVVLWYDINADRLIPAQSKSTEKVYLTKERLQLGIVQEN